MFEPIDLSGLLDHERFNFDRYSAGAHFFHPTVTRMDLFSNGNQAGFSERRYVARDCAAVALPAVAESAISLPAPAN